MALTGLLASGHLCQIFVANSSCLMKMCWPNMMKDFDDQKQIGFTSYRNVSDRKFLGRAIVWERISKSLFSTRSRTASRKKTSSFHSQCGLKQYIRIMIISLSGDISLNPGPENLDNTPPLLLQGNLENYCRHES